MTIWSPFAVEIGLGVLMLIVFAATLFARGGDRRAIGWLATIGVAVLLLGSLLAPPALTAPTGLGGMFVLDGLAIFAKRLFLLATFIGLLAGLSSPEPVLARRSGEDLEEGRQAHAGAWRGHAAGEGGGQPVIAVA